MYSTNKLQFTNKFGPFKKYLDVYGIKLLGLGSVGGQGKDIFKLSSGKGYDLIQDFKNKDDKIFIGSMNKLKLKNNGKDVYIFKGKDLLAKVKGAKGTLSKKGQYFI